MMLKFFVANYASQKNQIEELFNNFYMEEFSLNFFEYLERIKDDTFLVGELDLILLAKVLNIELGIYSLNLKNQKNNFDLNNDYNIYSSLKLVNFIKCKNPKFKIDLLLNNLENANSDENKTYHLITFNKTNPYFRHICDRKNEFISSLSEISFYDIKEIENVNFIRNFYFTNYVANTDAVNLNENEKENSFSYSKNKNFWKFNFNLFKLPEIKLNDDVKLSLMVIFAVLGFLTLRRLI